MAEPRFDEIDFYEKDELGKVDCTPPDTPWMETPTDMRLGSFIYPGKAKHLEYLGLPNPR